MAHSFKQVSPRERAMMKGWAEQGRSLSQIQALTGRSKTTIKHHLKENAASGVGSGRPKSITPDVYERLRLAREALQKKAAGQKEVTVAMIKKRARVDACDKVVLRAFHENGVWFHKLRERPILTKEDMDERLAFARKHQRRPSEAWVDWPHAVIDNKGFQLMLNKEGRSHSARRLVRGAYRAPGASPEPWLVRPKATLKFPAETVQVTAAVVNGKIRMWEYVDGRWNGERAAAMYRGPLRRAMEKAFPEEAAKARPRWVVMEDNDPAGYKSGKAAAAKDAARIRTLSLPRRSPDFNVLDYSLWHAINVRMRAAEAKMRPAKVETREEFLKRLRRCAMTLPKSVVEPAVKDMRRRLRLTVEAKGSLFTE